MSDQRKEIQELVDHIDLWENYFRNTIIPQLYVDAELTLRKFTPPAMTQFKLSESDIGKCVSDMKDNFRFPGIAENIQYVIESNEILEKEIQTTDLRWYQMNILPFVKGKENKSDGVILTFIEITMRIKDMKAQEKLVADTTILLDTIAHDLKNPLSNALVALELFKSVSPDDKEEFTTLHKMVDTSLVTMQKLISDLTEVRREEYENLADEELLNFENILEDVRLTLRDNIHAANARISTELNISQIRFSRRKLRTVMYNLLNNAIKFRSAERPLKIIVTTYKENNYVVISVRDNGIGVEEDNIARIFSKYQRLNKSVEGSGIGLYLVKEILTHTGGEITVDSRLGEGSEFKVYLRQEMKEF